MRPLSAVISRFDPGWLFLCAGLAVLSATVLIPANDDLSRAHLQRDRARAIEARAADRLAHYSEYLDALRQGDRTVTLALAATQLNLAPTDRRVIELSPDGWDPAAFDASVFDELEPDPTPLPELSLPDTALRRLTTDDRARLWLIAGGALCVLVGLLPASSPAPDDREDEVDANDELS
ncbi:MAG: hypothetical protein ACF8QF_03455 [Phycisphaerales bacterium]